MLRHPITLSTLSVTIALTVAALAAGAGTGDPTARRTDDRIGHPAGRQPGHPTIRRVILRSDGVDLHPSHELFGRGDLGIEVSNLTPELRRHFGAPADIGVLVGRVETDSPAARAGLRVGDVLTHADGHPLSTSRDLLRRVRPKSAGSELELSLVRDRRTQSAILRVVERDRPEIDILRILPGSGLWHRRGHPDDADLEIEIDGERLELGDAELIEAINELRSVVVRPDWPAQLKAFDREDFEIQRRMAELERRLEELRRRIDELSDE